MEHKLTLFLKNMVMVLAKNKNLVRKDDIIAKEWGLQISAWFIVLHKEVSLLSKL